MRNVKGLIKNFLPMERFYCISYYCVDFMAHNFTILVTATINLVSSNKKAPNWVLCPAPTGRQTKLATSYWT